VIGEALLLLVKWGPEIDTLIKILEGGKATPAQVTTALLKLETSAVAAELDKQYPGET
jgi:hypothetical protein